MASRVDPVQGTSLDIRVEDFLDDKLQSAADLEDLTSLLANVEVQRNQLQSQLDGAIQELEEARRNAYERQDVIAERIQEFQKLEEDIARRQQVASSTEAPDHAIARYKEYFDKIKNVELAQNYLILLQDVEKYRTEARSHLPNSPKDALEPYTKLRQLVTTLRGLPAQDGLHLVDYVERVTESLWDEMKKIMSTELEVILKQRKWPQVDPESEMDDECINSFEKLLDLQLPDILYSPGPVSLLPVDVMASIFITEFRYHFMSDKQTSAPKAFGSHCLPWFLSLIEKWENYFRNNLGHLLASKFHDTPAAENMAYIDPVCALITSMLPVLREKAMTLVGEAVKSPPFLSGFLSQLMTFDDNVRQRFRYDGGDAENGWPGLSTPIIDEHFDIWFQAEKDFALERFQTIMASQDSRNIDYDHAGKGKMKPTYAAVQITHLLRSITTQYARVRNFKQKIRFLIGIQLEILDGFHDRLRGSLEAYQSITSTLGRTLHGVTKEELAALEGTGALETLCKVIGSADHIVNTLKDWSNEEFFVSLWDELQTRASNRRSTNITSSLSYDDVKGRTSSAVGHESDDGALFDETVAAYSQRRKAGLDLLVGALIEANSKAFRPYTHNVQWTTIGDITVLDNDSVTPELDEPIRVLRSNFDFLARALSTATFRRVWRDTLSKLQDLLWHDVLTRQTFTTYGATQFLRDVAVLRGIVDRYIPAGSSALDSLHEGCRLLSLPVEAGDGGVLTLKVASDRVFTDNDQARSVLEEMGLEAISPPNARNILQRRVENSENVGW
ncbi:TIP-1 family-domain-containing protein [Thelonectria olida]|uniref:TIP-1 family-domain-containing protein n=1 Tax=Thelonectria olida TaxID=1576542 RepID=A0A9P8W541_9HYPO|nr:TIP-1 family-domain-containing protein [Thelonectria olida]